MPEPELPQRPRERTAGTAIKGGKLYRHDALGGVQVIRAWPDPQAWCRHDGGPWKALRPWVDLSAASEAHDPITWTSINEMEAFEQVPQEVVQAVVDAHLDRRQWAALQLAARVPAGLDLLRDVPLLGAAMACAWTVKPQPVARPLRSARGLLRQGRGAKTWRRIAAWLGFEGSAALVRTLRRVVVEPSRPWPVDLVVGLRAAWPHPRAKKLLLHADQVDHDVVLLVVRAVAHGVADRLHPGLLASAFNAGKATTVPSHLLDVAGAWQTMRPGRTFPVLRTPEELDGLREELRGEIEARFSLESEEEPEHFPPPPVPPLPAIRPLGSEDELVAESENMGNCLNEAHWAGWTKRRLGFAYCIDAGGDAKADVWLVPAQRRPGHFRVEEVRGPDNAPPAPACSRLIELWLREHERRVGTSATPLKLVPHAWRSAWTPRSSRSLPPELSWASDEIPF